MMNYMNPDYRPKHEELTSALFIEIGDDIILDICARVCGESVYNIEGTFLINDKDGNELASMAIDDDNVKFISAFLKRDIEQELYEDAYQWK